MANRLDLQKKLETILESRNVYYQPPESMKISYPAIVYELGGINAKRADNVPYINGRFYNVTLIHRDPDNTIVDKLLYMPYSSLNRTYKSDGLYHYVFEIYF